VGQPTEDEDQCPEYVITPIFYTWLWLKPQNPVLYHIILSCDVRVGRRNRKKDLEANT